MKNDLLSGIFVLALAYTANARNNPNFKFSLDRCSFTAIEQVSVLEGKSQPSFEVKIPGCNEPPYPGSLKVELYRRPEGLKEWVNWQKWKPVNDVIVTQVFGSKSKVNNPFVFDFTTQTRSDVKKPDDKPYLVYGFSEPTVDCTDTKTNNNCGYYDSIVKCNKETPDKSCNFVQPIIKFVYVENINGYGVLEWKNMNHFKVSRYRLMV